MKHTTPNCRHSFFIDILGHFRAYYYRALCYEKIGDLEKEEKDYRKAL